MTQSELDDILDSNDRMNRLAAAIADKLQPKINAAILKHSDSCPLATGQTGTLKGAAMAALIKSPVALAIIISAIILRHGLAAVALLFGA